VRPRLKADPGARQRAYLVVHDSARRRRTVLRPRYTPEQVLRLEHLGDVDQDTTSVFVRDAIVNDSLIWLGLGGGFAEGEGTLGGLYRINRRTGAWRHIVDTTLSWHAVNALAEVRGTLWIATEYPVELQTSGSAGLLRMRAGSTRWVGFNETNSPLPDALIENVGADRRAVAAATETGLAVGELDGTGKVVRWNVRQYVPGFIGDSLVMRLADSTAKLTDAAESPFMFAQRFAARGRERALYEVVRRADPDTVLRIVGADEPNAGGLLADPAALPAIATLLAGGRESRKIAADALIQLNAPAPNITPLVRSAFQAIDTVSTELLLWSQVRSQLGRALNRSNDSTAIKWARAQLDRARREQRPADPVAFARWDYNVAAAARIMGDARDPEALSSVLAIAPLVDRNDRWMLIDPLLSFDMPSAWQAAFALMESGYFDRVQFVTALGSVARADSAPTSRLVDVLTQALADSSGRTRRGAIYAARTMRLQAMVPPLVRSLDRERNGWFPDVLAALVSLTGRADAPAYSRDMTRAAADWWNNLLATSGGTIPVVSTEEGERALSDWSRRGRTT
jgi:hypothetical protein